MQSTSLRFSDIEAARHRIRDAVYLSPCAHSRVLSAMTDSQLYLKLENLQMTGSFKERGAVNRLALMPTEQRAAGVVAASAGNHAQALAFVAQRCGVRATIVMPVGTPLIKVSSTRTYGARVVLHGESYDEAAAEARRIAAETGMTLVHPFDDEAVIAGQGTLGLELIELLPDLDAVFAPIGGGGLFGGMGLAIKSLRPDAAVYGVEAALVPSMQRALERGAPVLCAAARTLADGIAVREVGAHTLPLVQRYVDRVVSVEEEDIAQAVLLLLEREKTVAEGAGAAPLAAALHGELPIEGKRVALVVSGGNIDVNVLSRIIDRGLVKSGRSMRVRVLVPDVPGALARLLSVIAKHQANVLQIHHDRVAARTELGVTSVELVLETRGLEHIVELEQALTAAGAQIQR
jgi:threonine dehydratase